MASSAPTSSSQQQQSAMNNDRSADQHGGGADGRGQRHHHRNHAIARVASAHGPRDSILSFQQHHHQQQQLQQQYHRHHSPSPMITTTGPTPPSRLVGGSAPPALCSGASSMALPPPPQYEQAVAAAAASVVDENGAEILNAGGVGNLAKFANRRSPESRTPIQAVLPMQPSLTREVIPSPTSIPDECQVVKQLVREMASGQLSIQGIASSDGAAAIVGQQTILAPPPPPPAYSQHQFQTTQQQQPSNRQQQSQPLIHHQKSANVQQHSSSTAHPLLDGGGGANFGDGNHPYVHQAQSPKDTNNNAPGQRISLSHSDLSRLQNMQLSSTWQGASAADEPPHGAATVPSSVLQSAAALSAMANSLAANSAAVQQQQQPSTAAKISHHQRSNPPAMSLQQQQHQQLLMQQQQQQMAANAVAAMNQQQQQQQQVLAGRFIDQNPSFLSGGHTSASANRLASYLQSQAPAAAASTSHHYEVLRSMDGSTAYLQQTTVPQAMLAGGMHPQAIAAAGHGGIAGHEFVHRSSVDAAYEADLEANHNAFTRMINLLKEENKQLRTDLENYMKKAFKLQQLELLHKKLYREYEELVQRQEKREGLDQQLQQMVTNVRGENARLRDMNIHLREQLESTMAHIRTTADDGEDSADLRGELMRREMIMAQFITQNKELIACKERQEIELEAQRQTLEDQRNHIQVLDRALNNAQERNLRLDEECKKKASYVQRTEQLQRSLQQQQEASQKSDENHKRVRAQLEAELAQLQVQKKDTQVKKANSSRCLQEYDDTVSKLKRDVRDKDDQLASQQQELLQWQNMFYEEQKKRTAALDQAADSKDVRMRLLEESSDKAEKMAESARGETKRYLEDLRLSKTKVTDLETKIQSCEALIAEKDAMINVLRRRQNQNALYGDSSINTRSAEATLTEPYDPNPQEIKNRLEMTKRRILQSPSPSRYTPSRLYQRHAHKFTSIDASFGLDDTEYGSLGRAGRRNKPIASTNSNNSSSMGGIGGGTTTAAMFGGGGGSPEISAGRIQHNRTQSSCDSYLSPSGGGGGIGATSTPISSTVLNAFKQREIFTLPTRRSRTKLLTTEQVKSNRPRSADEHLLNRPDETTENTIETAASSTKAKLPAASPALEAKKLNSSAAKIQTEEPTGEELWHV